MKKEINRTQKILLLVIAVLAVVLAAMLVHKGYQLYQDRLQAKEWEVRHQETQSEIEDVQVQIQELSGDGEALQKFLDEKLNPAIVVEEPENNAIVIEESDAAESGAKEAESISDNTEEQKEAERVSENAVPENVEEETVSENEISEIGSEESVSGNELAEGESISGNELAKSESISGNGILVTDMKESISGNAIVNGQVIPFRYEEVLPTLEERRAIRSSYEETVMTNTADKEIIRNNTFDFSGMKIACLGDSITAGSNMDSMENYQQYAYPAVLKNVLQAEEVYNLGIGGSSYGRYWDKPFVERYKEIPEDTDIILVMGGTNDGFAASTKELGSMEEKKARTFYGDVDELMRGLKQTYPMAKIIFATPLPNVLHDYLRNERDYLLPQSVFADAVKELAVQYNIDVIDLYNSNVLDTHDTQIITTFMPDGVHGNTEGYQVLAEHMAGQIIQIMEKDALYKPSVSANLPESSVSDNLSDESISGNGMMTIEDAENTVSQNQKTENALIIIGPSGEEKIVIPEETEPVEPEKDYEYDGEAIIIE